MTTEQARKMVDNAEQEIVAKHNTLCTLADSTESEAGAAASSTSTKKTMTPLIILIVVGVILMLVGSAILGILAIGGGIYWARKANQTAKEAESKVTNLRNNYKTAINNNRAI
mgnify:CR=1 FL=1